MVRLIYNSGTLEDLEIQGFNSLNGAIDIEDNRLIDNRIYRFQFLKWCDWYLNLCSTRIKLKRFQFLKWCDWYDHKFTRLVPDPDRFNSLNGAIDIKTIFEYAPNSIGFQFLKWCDWYYMTVTKRIGSYKFQFLKWCDWYFEFPSHAYPISNVSIP